ncbi:hypothetical protein Poly51_52440 [Rubripirellula tenax]|uniref:Uncharacterized protein n=1 Tax=Rubripirellula tenax TaxID=2528015 RepID=A0A5C6EG65_9BACT|nr:hypothetical protein Poly51_52440 [Rubripirellula tenax]
MAQIVSPVPRNAIASAWVTEMLTYVKASAAPVPVNMECSFVGFFSPMVTESTRINWPDNHFFLVLGSV